MPYSFIRLYLFKSDVCVLIFIRIKPKRFLIILYVFGSDFYHSLFSCFVFTLFFHYFKHVLCWKIGVRVFRDSLATCKKFCDLYRDSPIAQLKSWVHLEAFASHLAPCSRLALRLAQSWNAQKQLFKGLFVGNLF